MTHNNGSSFVHDLVAMATAADRVPELERQVSEQVKTIIHKQELIERLEIAAVDHAVEVANLKAALTQAQEERDSASFRELETEDKVAGLRRAIEYCQDALGDALRAIEPPEPKPIKPSYEGKWLTDVMGWSELTLNQWLECGGTYERFTVVKPVEAQPVPNEPAHSEFTFGSEANPFLSQTTVEPTAASSLPSAECLEGATQEGRESFPPTQVEDTATSTEAQSVPSAEKDIAHASTEADVTSSSPFAVGPTTDTTPPSPLALIGDVDMTTPAPSPKATEDGELDTDWPWSFSHASHVS